MTRTRKDAQSTQSRRILRPAHPARWMLQDAKARFSEVVRRANSEGPQHVTVRGRDEAVVVSAREFRRLTGRRSGKLLVELMRRSPLRDVTIERISVHTPVRVVEI